LPIDTKIAAETTSSLVNVFFGAHHTPEKADSSAKPASE
jgi:hypothetical protein